MYTLPSSSWSISILSLSPYNNSQSTWILANISSTWVDTVQLWKSCGDQNGVHNVKVSCSAGADVGAGVFDKADHVRGNDGQDAQDAIEIALGGSEQRQLEATSD